MLLQTTFFITLVLSCPTMPTTHSSTFYFPTQETMQTFFYNGVKGKKQVRYINQTCTIIDTIHGEVEEHTHGLRWKGYVDVLP